MSSKLWTHFSASGRAVKKFCEDSCQLYHTHTLVDVIQASRLMSPGHGELLSHLAGLYRNWSCGKVVTVHSARCQTAAPGSKGSGGKRLFFCGGSEMTTKLLS